MEILNILCLIIFFDKTNIYGDINAQRALGPGRVGPGRVGPGRVMSGIGLGDENNHFFFYEPYSKNSSFSSYG